MDNKKFGEFITLLRKEKDLTQVELAKKINVTDKAISRWERGHGFPDINTIEPLANALDVSILEIMRSERIVGEEVLKEDANEAVNSIIDVAQNMRKLNRRNSYIGKIITLIILLLFVYHEIRHYIISFPYTDQFVIEYFASMKPMSEYINSDPPGSVDKYQDASEAFTFHLIPRESYKVIDCEATYNDKRFRVIRYYFENHKERDMLFENLTIHRFPDTESNSWFIWKKSEYAGYHWNNDGAGPYVRIWNDKYGVTLMLSEDRDSSDLLMKKIIERIYFNENN